MNLADLEQEIAVELEALQTTVDELLALQHDAADREPTVREKTAAAAFLAQFYNGVENILFRLPGNFEQLGSCPWSHQRSPFPVRPRQVKTVKPL